MAQTLGLTWRDRAVVQGRAIERPEVLEEEAATLSVDAGMVPADLLRYQHQVVVVLAPDPQLLIAKVQDLDQHVSPHHDKLGGYIAVLVT